MSDDGARKRTNGRNHVAAPKPVAVPPSGTTAAVPQGSIALEQAAGAPDVRRAVGESRRGSALAGKEAPTAAPAKAPRAPARVGQPAPSVPRKGAGPQPKGRSAPIPMSTPQPTT